MPGNSAQILSFEPQGQEEPQTAEFPLVNTMLSKVLGRHLDLAHILPRIGIISGPAGIGKTTALRAFAARHSGEVVIVTVSKPNRDKGHSPSQTLRMMIEALLGGPQWAHCHMPNSDAQYVLADFAGQALANAFPQSCRLTIVFDEAQNLSAGAIEMLRFWYDNADKRLPNKLGLIFVGNDEFSLKQKSRGQSTISEQVGSRAGRPLALERADLSSDDIAAFVKSRGITAAEAIATILAFIDRNPACRDLRWIGDELRVCQMIAGAEPVSPAIVRKVLTGR